jgi:hypothetical protein
MIIDHPVSGFFVVSHFPWNSNYSTTLRQQVLPVCRGDVPRLNLFEDCQCLPDVFYVTCTLRGSLAPDLRSIIAGVCLLIAPKFFLAGPLEL